jgi:alpha-galactosidase
LTAGAESIERIQLRWALRVPDELRYSGDAWERGYGDLEWRFLVPDRVMPWYFLAFDGQATHAYGVKVQAGALCCWMVDNAGVSLWLDVRNGGSGVELNGRPLQVCEIVTRQGREGETPFAAAQAFCRVMCPQPRLPAQPVYGSNNWYYAYGKSSHTAILADTQLLVELAPGGENRPYMVIDGGWQPRADADIICGGPYEPGSAQFPDMAGLAAQMRALGAHPGIWMRPLAAYPGDPAEYLLNPVRAVNPSEMGDILDPTHPEVLARLSEDIRRLRAWGYELIKHDFSTWDIFGRWGFQMGTKVTNAGWNFRDRSRTNAEIILDLYKTIRTAADAATPPTNGTPLIIGCNTIGHLTAGLYELQRAGDDTSGREWERTRKMGINTLAFRGPQHNTFFAVDADCMGYTESMPWEPNRQWLDLLARSGTPLFVSADPKLTGPVQRQALQAAFARAAQPQPQAEPLNWLSNACPTRWQTAEGVVEYDWANETGVPFHSSIPFWWGTTG